jgi:flagellar FliL protein
MKKNLISVLILALCLVNVVLSAIMMFTIMPQTKKANELIEKVCSAIDLDLNSGAVGSTSASNVPIDKQELYLVGAGADITCNLAQGDDGQKHYAVVAVSLVLNIESENYEKYNQDFLTSQDSSIQADITKVISSYTYDQFTSDQQAVQDQILTDMQGIFGSDYVVGVNFSKSTAE